MIFKIAVLPGDGIGPEVCREAVRILRALNVFCHCEFHIEERAIGGAAIKATGSPLPETTLQACLKSHAVLLGAVGAPEFDELSTEERPEAGALRLCPATGGFANLCSAVRVPAPSGLLPLKKLKTEEGGVTVFLEP